MGLVDYSGGRTFINIKDGRLIIKKDGVTEEHGGIEGLLTDIEVIDDEYQGEKYKKLRLTLQDGGDRYQLDMKLDSSYGRAFCQTIPNADFTLPMTLVPNMKNVDGKDQRTLFITQRPAGATKPLALKRRFTKDNPEGCPSLVKETFRGKDYWDNTAQQAFFIELLVHKIRPALAHPIMGGPASEASRQPPGGSNRATPPRTAADVTEPIDDLPF